MSTASADRIADVPRSFIREILRVTLPERTSSMRLFERALARKVALVPGAPFHVGRPDANTPRHNLSCVGGRTIEEGLGRSAAALSEVI